MEVKVTLVVSLCCVHSRVFILSEMIIEACSCTNTLVARSQTVAPIPCEEASFLVCERARLLMKLTVELTHTIRQNAASVHLHYIKHL